MANNSFYGGKPGASFIVVKNFPSIAEMVNNFGKGPDYTEVHYDEHVIINTENKNDADNGKIYRRGYDYTNELGGAIYVGTIVGPAGRAPMVELATIEEVKEKQDTEGFEDRYTEGSYSVPVSLVPGKDGEQYNDNIDWACCCVRNENNEDSTAYIGFKFPYLVVDLEADSVDPYYNRSDDTENFVNQLLFDRIDDKNHPFYEKWRVSIPKGIKGNTIKNCRAMIADETIEDYEGRQDDIDNNRMVFVGDYYNYDRSPEGDFVTIYLGPYNIVEDIRVEEDGTIIIDYSYKENEVFDKILKVIDNIYLDEEDHKFHVVYNTGDDEPIDNIIKFIENIYIDENEDDGDYKFHVVYNTGDDEPIGSPINYIVETAIDKADYHYLVYYSNANFRKSIIEAGNGRTYNGKSGWLDLGSIKDDSGVLVGFNIPLSETEDLESIIDAINYLNSLYPSGLTDPLYYGKIITIGNSYDSKSFYAFDYDKRTWYYLGKFQDTDSWILISREDAPNLGELKNKTAIGGVWFVVEGQND